MKQRFHLTFDIDWAPDHSVASLRALLDQYQVKATFFVTHESDTLSDLRASGHRLGVHPNFLPGSSHGNSPAEIMDFVMSLVPDARVMRTHGLHQSSNLFLEILQRYPQIDTDLSTLTFDFPVVQSFPWTFGSHALRRYNYNWEDDVCFYRSGYDWSTPRFPAPVTIFDFHPIHFSLNSSSEHHYQNLKAEMAGSALQNGTEEQIERFRNPDVGAFDNLVAILESGAVSIDLEDIA